MALPGRDSSFAVKPHPPVKPPAQTGYAPSQVAASLAANPNASKGGYEGAPLGDQYATTDPYATVDPILEKIRAGNETARANARTDAIANVKRLAIQLGDGNGFGVDQTTQAEAAGNPYSTLATVLKNYQDTSHAHDEQLNKDNLFYSGARVKQLGEDANAYQRDVYNARGSALDQFGGIQASLASALSGANGADRAAEGDAYGRSTARALTYGYDPGITDNAHANMGQPPAATSSTPGFGTSTSALGQRAGSGAAAALARTRPVNPYATGTKLRG